MFVLFIFPISNNVYLRRWPWMNIAFIVTNIGLFLWILVQNGSFALPERIVSTYGVNPMGFHPYQLLTSLFLHADYVHLVGNMVFLWVFGNALNSRLGHFWYLLYYCAAGIVTGLGFLLLQANYTPAIGASGAIAAVVGGYFVLFSRSEVKIFLFVLWGRFHKFHWVDAKAVILLYVIFDVLRIVFGSGSVAWSAHLTGYVAGGVGTYYLANSGFIMVDSYSFLSDE